MPVMTAQWKLPGSAACLYSRQSVSVSRKPFPSPLISVAWTVSDGDTLFFHLNTRFREDVANSYALSSRELRRQVGAILESLPQSDRALTCLTRRHTLIVYDRYRMSGISSSYVLMTAAYMGFSRGNDDEPLKNALLQLGRLASSLFRLAIEEAETDNWVVYDAEEVMLDYRRQLELVIILLAAGCHPRRNWYFGADAIISESSFVPAMLHCKEQFEKLLEAGLRFSAQPRVDPRNGDPRTCHEQMTTARQLFARTNRVMSLQQLASNAARIAMFPNAFVGNRRLHAVRRRSRHGRRHCRCDGSQHDESSPKLPFCIHLNLGYGYKRLFREFARKHIHNKHLDKPFHQ